MRTKSWGVLALINCGMRNLRVIWNPLEPLFGLPEHLLTCCPLFSFFCLVCVGYCFAQAALFILSLQFSRKLHTHLFPNGKKKNLFSVQQEEHNGDHVCVGRSIICSCSPILAKIPANLRLEPFCCFCPNLGRCKLLAQFLPRVAE